MAIDEVQTRTSSSLAGSLPEQAAVREYALGLVKVAIGSVPYVGSLLNEVIFDARARLEQRRVETFFMGVAAHVERLEESKLDKNYIASDEFSDVLIDVARRVSRTSSDSKRARLRTVLLKAMHGSRFLDLTPTFMNMLEEISEPELLVLDKVCLATESMNVAKETDPNADLIPFDYAAPDILGMPPMQFRLVVQCLVGKGLALDDGPGRFGGTQDARYVRSTLLGAAFLDWVRD